MNYNSKGFNISSVLIIFSTASIVLFLETHFLIPYLSDTTGLEPVIFWFAVAGLGMFLPLILAAVYFIKSEGLQLNRSTWTTRMRFRKLKKKTEITFQCLHHVNRNHIMGCLGKR